ncbi:hypothetical protein DFP72DRAFT_911914 [Ephemerocybe angulata]|uniref:Uncharacterized protein n=1 Tax=Ephemerocybe angulata TaxID=980116 RepID=A0A8H6HMP3_9AGAR|nr:hypothetical protein DFP72DRAFT_911914 [Tulosesus angulatus]
MAVPSGSSSLGSVELRVRCLAVSVPLRVPWTASLVVSSLRVVPPLRLSFSVFELVGRDVAALIIGLVPVVIPFSHGGRYFFVHWFGLSDLRWVLLLGFGRLDLRFGSGLGLHALRYLVSLLDCWDGRIFYGRLRGRSLDRCRRYFRGVSSGRSLRLTFILCGGRSCSCLGLLPLTLVEVFVLVRAVVVF